jgi:phage terminase small subunit
LIVLTHKQARFTQEYLVDGNATQAAIRARYSPKTAGVIGYENLRKPQIAEAIAGARAKLAERLEVTSARIVTELAKLGFANMADYMRANPGGDPYLDFSRLTRDQAAALAEVTVDDFVDGRGENARQVKRVRFKLHDKQAALVNLGRHLGIFADRHVIEGSIEHKVMMMTREQRLARVDELLESARRYLPFEQIEAEADAAHDGEASEVPPTEG